MFELKLFVFSLFLSVAIDSCLEAFAVSSFNSKGELVGLNFITDTQLYGRGCSVPAMRGSVFNIMNTSGVDLCECPSPALTGNFDVYGRLHKNGVVEYLCADGWYSKIIKISDV